MKLKLENVNLSSNSGPNSFASKLSSYIGDHGVELNSGIADAYLCFIESSRQKYDKPMYQRLDGIYFNTVQDYNSLNSNIRRTYEMSSMAGGAVQGYGAPLGTKRRKNKKTKHPPYNELYLYKEVLKLLMKEGVIK